MPLQCSSKYIYANLYPVPPPILPSLHILPFYSKVTLSHVASFYVFLYTFVPVSKTSGLTNISVFGNTLTTQAIYYSVLRLSIPTHLSLGTTSWTQAQGDNSVQFAVLL
jgi:hypothetical protein